MKKVQDCNPAKPTLFNTYSSLQSIPDYSDLIHLTNLELDLTKWGGNWLMDADGEPVRSVVIESQEWSVDWIWRLSKLKKLYLRMPTSCTTTIQSVESSSDGLAQLEHLTLCCSIFVLESTLGRVKPNGPAESNHICKWGSILKPIGYRRRWPTYLYTTRLQMYQPVWYSRLTVECLFQHFVTCVIPSFLCALTRLDISLYRETMTLSLPRLNRLTHFSLSDSGDLSQILGLGELQSLISLVISKCNSLEALDGIPKLRRLVNLEIHQCKKLRVISVVPCVRFLKKVLVIGCESLESLVGTFEESESCLDDLHRVERLKIVNCPLLENKLPCDLELLKGKFLVEEKRRRRRS